MKAQVVIPVIIVMLILTIPNSAYAMKFIDLPPVSKKSLAEIVEEQIKIIEHGNLRAEFRPLYTVADDPALHVVPPGGTLDGVGEITIVRTDGTVLCSGALLTSGMHVLTAAHCFTDGLGNLITTAASITFETVSGDETISGTEVFIHPDWDGDSFRGNDIVVLELASVPSSSIDRYDIDRVGADDVGTTGTKVGYGSSGTGLTGVTIGAGTKRQGLNLYDDVADTMLIALGLTPSVDFVPGSVLQYDFDNGLAANDAFGFFFGNTDLGLGNDEVNSAPGDSGGPTFSLVITGVTSYGVRLTFFPPCGPNSPFGPCTSDIDGALNSSFGEFSGDTRVSFYAAFVDAILDEASAPVCGNEIVESGEDCDLGSNNGVFGFCCGATCSFEPATTLCNLGSGDLCDPDEVCSGTSVACPADSFEPSTTVCNAGSGDICDPDELCSGVADAACPADSFEPSTTVCNADSGDVCDPDELCSGVADAACPADSFLPDGATCDDGQISTFPDTCQSGFCTGISILECIPPTSGDWIISNSCTLSTSSTAPANVIVQNNSVLTIPAGLSLDIDFVNNFLKIEFGSGVLIKSGGAVT